jgi:hypothetical protein
VTPVLPLSNYLDRPALASVLREHPTAADEQLDELLQGIGSRYAPGHQAHMLHVGHALCAVVDELRLSGLSPEHVVIIVKAHLLIHVRTPESVQQDLVRMCILRYYDRDECTGPRISDS